MEAYGYSDASRTYPRQVGGMLGEDRRRFGETNIPVELAALLGIPRACV